MRKYRAVSGSGWLSHLWGGPVSSGGIYDYGLVRKLTVRRCAGFFVGTKANFSDDSELSELKSNAGDGQKGKQICADYFRTGPKWA
ncbi:MAG: hypothetical protein ACI9R3_004640 [Verrucomicrobiales bacterium]|jgi:hypothetical protein